MVKPKWIKEIGALGWDLDGTLYHPEAVAKNMIRERQVGAVMEKTGWGQKRAVAEFDRLYHQLGSTTKAMSELGINGVNFYVELWDELPLKKYLKPDRRLRQMFGKLAGRRHFIVSNSNTREQIKNKLRLLGLRHDMFEVIVSTVGLGSVKPEPKPFLVALEKLGLPAKEVLYIGDKEKTDIVGAKRVGMRTCLVWGKSEIADISLATVYDVKQLFV